MRGRKMLRGKANRRSFRRHSIPKADNVLGCRMARGGNRN